MTILAQCGRTVGWGQRPYPEAWVTSRVKKMMLDEKLGQMFVPRFLGGSVDENIRRTIQEKHIEGIISTSSGPGIC